MIKIRQLKYISVFFLIVLITSCEELIEIELNSTELILVAEGVIERGEPAWLRLSYTSDYFSNEAANYYENSTAQITDENGNNEILQYEGEGLYRGKQILGRTNTSYTLNFTEGDNYYQASSTMLPSVKIKEVWFEQTKIQTLDENKIGYFIHIVYSNIPDQKNYYLFRFYTNGKLDNNGYSLANSSYYPDDAYLNYKPIRVNFDKGDKVKIQVYSLDENTYNYFNQLNDLLGGSLEGSSTPYNPKSNFGDGIMGNFTAWTYDTFDAVVK